MRTKWLDLVFKGALLGLFQSATPCFSAVFNVINANDGGAGSLRQAIIDSNASAGSLPNTINFNALYAINLASSLPLITNPVTINGSNSSINGQNQWRSFAFQLANAGNCEIANMTIRNCLGKGGNGGDHSANPARWGSGGGGAGFGGGFCDITNGVVPTYTFTNVTFNTNRALGGNGGSYVFPGVNQAGSGGGGMLTAGTQSAGGAQGVGGNGLNGAGGGDPGGGFGGGGAGGPPGTPGRQGGFGGGGGGCGGSGLNQGGNGGFGGGGGGSSTGNNSFGGFGGGDGIGNGYNNNVGGGGAGLGGAIFVYRTNQIELVNPTFMGNTAVGGNGGVGNMLMAPNGQGIGPDLFMMSGSTVTFNLTNDLIINSVIASDNGAGGGAINTGGITKTGTATLTLGGANTYTGITSINGGTLSISNDGNLGELTNPISFDGGTLHVTGAPFGTGRDVELVGDGTIDIIDGGGFLIAGVISGVGSLTKTNTTGTLVFQGANTYSSTTTISKGVLGANAADTFSPNSAVVLSDVLGAVLDLNDFDNTILSLSGGGPAGGNVMLGTATLKTGDATDTTYSGVISETGNLIKQGSGIFTLSGVNTYTGTTTVSEGTLALFEEGDISASSEVILSAMTTFDISEVTNGATIKDLNGAVGSELVLGAKTLTLGTSTASTTFSGLISGMGGSLIKNGSGTIILTNSNTYTGGNTFNAGIVSISATDALGTAGTMTFDGGSLQATDSISIPNTANLISDGTIDVTGANVLTMTGAISGAGDLIKNGSGTLLLKAMNTYMGATKIDEGTLEVDVLNALPMNTDVTLLDVAGVILKPSFSTTIGSLSGGGTTGGEVQLAAGTTLTTGNANSSTSFGGIISGGTGALVKEGTGTFTLTGTQTYSGATTVSEGTLALSGAAGSIAASSGVDLTAVGATFDISAGPAATTINDLSGVAGSSVKLGGKALTAGTVNDKVFSGVMSGTGTFTKQGSGKITFGGVNTYTGLTTISEGTLALSGAGEISASSGVTLTTATANFDISAATGGATIGDLSGVGGSELILGDKALILGTSNNSTFSGLISGMGGSLVKDGIGTLSLTNTNTYTGGTNLAAGIVSISATNALGTGQVTFATGNLEASGSIMIPNAAWLKFNGAIDIPAMGDSLTMTGAIFGSGNLIKEGEGTLVLSPNPTPNTYSGATVINAGTLQLGVVNALPAVTNVVLADFTGALLDLDGKNTTILSLSSGGTTGGNVHLGSGTLTVSGNAITTYGGVISQAGSLVKGGGGTLTLTGTNLYTGNTTINGGTLALSGTGSIATSSEVNVNASGTFNISATTAGATIQDLSGAVGGKVILGNQTLTAGTGNSTAFDGVISGTGGGFTKVNGGVLTLSGVNTYTGITTITGGTLKLSGSGSIAASSTVDVVGTFDIIAATAGVIIQDLTGAGSVALGSNTLTAGTGNSTTFNGMILGMGGFTKQGSGTLSLGGMNSYVGPTQINLGKIKIQNANALPVTTEVTLANAIAALDLNNISITIGSLSGGGSSGGNTLLGSGTLTLGNGGNQTYNGIISGTGSLVKQNAGIFIVTGANIYSGGTTVMGGTLQGNSTSLQGDIAVAATLVFDQDFNGTYAGVLTGAGSLIKQNTGTLTISGNSSMFSGTVAINQGKALVNGNLQGAFTVTASGILGGTGTTGSVMNNGIVAPGASIGTLTVNGNYTQTGTLQIEMDSTGASDLLQVNGTAMLGGILDVFLAPGTYLEGTQYQIVTSTGARSGTFANAEVGTPFLRDYGQLFFTNYEPNGVMIVTITDFFVLNSGNPPNPFANYFFCDSFVFGNKQLLEVAQAISVLDPYQFAIASSKMGPGQFGALPILDMENNIRISNTFFDWFDLANCCELQVEEKPKKRTSHFRRKENRGTTAYPQFNIRFTPIGFVYSQTKTEDDLPKFNTSTLGGVATIDHEIANHMVFGGALAYTYSHVHWSRKQGHANNESAYLAPYVSFDNGNFYSGAAIQGTLNFYHVKRKMSFPGYENKAKNYHRSFDLLTKVLIGGKIHAAELLRFQPEAQLDYVNVYEEKYKEKKAGSVSLKVKSKHSAYLRGTFTMKGVVEKEFENSCFNASFKTGFFVTNPLYSADYTSAFKDSPGCASNFTVSSYKDTMVQAVLGAGLSFMKSCMGGSVNYEGSFGYGGDPNANELTLSGFWEF